ncbi:arfaptin-like domain-containing protein [Ditylenchus destructor]|nr:arfaptin-like domain-containing protein [Ditylenchus destructor]
MQTLSDKTIQDTLLTVDRHDQARLEYDVYRYELENLRSQPNPMASLDEAEQKAAAAKSKYDQLKEDVRIKLTLLEENRGKVMRRQIALVQKAFGSYFEGNTETLKKTLEQLGDGAELTPIEDDDPMSNHVKHPPSFLENNM